MQDDPLDVRAVLARNVRRLMDESADIDGKALRLAHAAKVGQATVDRMLAGKAYSRLDSIEAVAAYFGVSPWLLLHPNPQMAQSESEFYAKMRGLLAQQNGK